MFQEVNYLNGDEPYACVQASKNACLWAGCLYERKDGGFDLWYDHENSEFDQLDLAMITALRQIALAENGLAFVAHLESGNTKRKLSEQAKQCLLDWVSNKTGS